MCAPELPLLLDALVLRSAVRSPLAQDADTSFGGGGIETLAGASCFGWGRRLAGKGSFRSFDGVSVWKHACALFGGTVGQRSQQISLEDFMAAI